MSMLAVNLVHHLHLILCLLSCLAICHSDAIDKKENQTKHLCAYFNRVCKRQFITLHCPIFIKFTVRCTFATVMCAAHGIITAREIVTRSSRSKFTAQRRDASASAAAEGAVTRT